MAHGTLTSMQAAERRSRTPAGRLDGIISLVAAGLAIVPVLAASGWAIAFGWAGGGDDALLSIRSWDVLHGDLPLLGMPSTLKSPHPGVLIHHPGPAPFYVLAPFTALTQQSWGVVLGVLAVHVVAIVLAFGSASRLGGPTFATLTMLAMIVLEATLGTQILYRPFNTFLPLLVYVALGLALAELLNGRVRSLVTIALLGSFTAQAHLSGLGPTAVIVIIAIVGYGLSVRRARHDAARAEPTTAEPTTAEPATAEPGETTDLADAAAPTKRPRRPWTDAQWAIAALAIALVGWLPVLWQQLTGSTGNLWAIQGGLRASRSTLGVGKGLSLAARVVGLPPPFGLPTNGDSPFVSLDGLGASGILVLVPLGLLLAIGAWNHRSTRPRLVDHRQIQSVIVVALTSWFVLVVSAINAPQNVFYQVAALWPLAIVVWLAIVWTGWRSFERWRGPRPQRQELLRYGVVGVALLIVVAAVVSSPLSRESPHRQVEIRVARSLDRAARDAGVTGTVTVVVQGGDAFAMAAPIVVGALQRQGHEVHVDEPFRDHIQVYGQRRAPIDRPTERLVVASGPTPVKGPAGYRQVAVIPTGKDGQDYALFLSPGPVTAH